MLTVQEEPRPSVAFVTVTVLAVVLIVAPVQVVENTGVVVVSIDGGNVFVPLIRATSTHVLGPNAITRVVNWLNEAGI